MTSVMPPTFPESSGLRQRVKGSTPPPLIDVLVAASPPKKTAKESLKAIVRLQRAFRRVLYRFDRNALIDRLRLELRLKIVGGRVIVWFMLLVVVCLNMMSTNESSSYNLTLTSSLSSILNIDGFSACSFWTDAFSQIDSLLLLFYSFSQSSASLSVWPPATDLPVVVDSPVLVKAASFALSTWTVGPDRSLLAIAANQTFCWSITFEDYTVTVGSQFFSVPLEKSLLFFAFEDENTLRLNQTILGSFMVPDCGLNFVLTSNSSLSDPFSLFYFYPFSWSISQIPAALEFSLPFLTNSTDPYIYQSLPPLVAPTELTFPSNAYQFLTPGILFEQPASLSEFCEIDASAESAFLSVYGSLTNTTLNWCLSPIDPPLSFSSQFISNGGGSKFVSFLFPGDLASRGNTQGLLIRQLVWIPTSDRVALVELSSQGARLGASSADFLGDNNGFSGKLFQAFYSPQGLGWRGTLFSTSGITGIVIASFFLLKDLLLLVVAVREWRPRSGPHFFVWLTSNVLTNLCVLTLLVGRVSVGPNDLAPFVNSIAIALRGEEGWAEKQTTVGANLASISDSFLTFREWEVFGIGVMYLLFARVVHSLSGHPRVGILTATWREASDNFFHLSLNFVSLFLLQGIIGMLVNCASQSNSSGDTGQVLMATFGQVLLSQWHALVSGGWTEVSGDLNVHGSDWVVILYFSVFLVTMRIFLLNFFIAILIDAYMAVRVGVSKTVQSFFRDTLDTVEAHWLVKTGRLPKRAQLITTLVDMYALPVVSIDQLGAQSVFGTQQAGQYLFSDKLRRFCSRYFRYNAVRSIPVHEQASWRTVIAEIEVLKKFVKTTTP